MGTAIVLATDGKHEVTLDGRVIARCKSRDAAERVIALRDKQMNDNALAREERARQNREYDAETERLMAAIKPRLRKVVSREPGYAVNCLFDRCVAVPTFWGAPVRTCIVIMRAGTDLTGTQPLTDEDYAQVECEIDTDDECRAIVARQTDGN